MKNIKQLTIQIPNPARTTPRQPQLVSSPEIITHSDSSDSSDSENIIDLNRPYTQESNSSTPSVISETSSDSIDVLDLPFLPQPNPRSRKRTRDEFEEDQ